MVNLVHEGFKLVEMEAVVVLDKGRLDSDEGIDNLFIADRLGRVVHGRVEPAPQLLYNILHPPEGQFLGQSFDIAIITLHQGHAQLIGHIRGDGGGHKRIAVAVAAGPEPKLNDRGAIETAVAQRLFNTRIQLPHGLVIHMAQQVDNVLGFVKGGRLPGIDQGGQPQLLQCQVDSIDIVACDHRFQFADDIQNRRRVKLGGMRRKNEAGTETGQVVRQAAGLVIALQQGDAVLERQVILQLHQLFEGGIFRTVVEHDLPLDILDDIEHEINFLFFRFHAGVNVEKGLEDRQRVTFRVKALLTHMVQQGNEHAYVADFSERQIQKQAVVDIELRLDRFFKCFQPCGIIHRFHSLDLNRQEKIDRYALPFYRASRRSSLTGFGSHFFRWCPA